jgi:nucleotide-binding universal stress UspA family protein
MEALPDTVVRRDAALFVDPDPENVLLELAGDPTRILCFASHDHARPAAAIRHSVGSYLIERATQPFLVVGKDAGRARPTAGVVVALDGRDRTGGPLATGLAWARDLHASLRLVTVFEPIPPDLRDPSHYSRTVGPTGDPARYLETMRGRLGDASGVVVEVAAVPDPVGVVSGLDHHLRDRPAFLLVVGRGLHGARGLGPSVVRGLLREVSTPLLVVPSVDEHAHHGEQSVSARVE